MHGVAVTKKVVNFSLKWRNQRSRPYKLVLELLELPATQKQAATASPHFSVKAFVQIENERVVQIKLCFTVNSSLKRVLLKRSLPDNTRKMPQKCLTYNVSLKMSQ